MPNRSLTLPSLLLGLLASWPAQAQQRMELPRAGDILETTAAALPLRDGTPDPSFGGKAPQVGWVKRGELVKVLSTKAYLSVMGTEIWIEVQKEGEGQQGWVFGGMAGSEQPGDFGFAQAPGSAGTARTIEAARAAELSRATDSLIEDEER